MLPALNILKTGDNTADPTTKNNKWTASSAVGISPLKRERTNKTRKLSQKTDADSQ